MDKADKRVDRGEEKSGFWTTLPGILTAFATLVTAIGGVVLGLYQYGVLGTKPGQPAKQISRGSPQTEQREGPTDQPQHPNPLTIPEKQGSEQETVVVTARDGTVTTLFASNFRQLAQYDDQLHLLSGQAIALDRIKSLDVVRVLSDHLEVKVTLVDGSVLDASLGAGSSIYGFTGENQLGTFDITDDRLKRIVFQR